MAGGWRVLAPPAVEEGEQPVVVLEEGEGVDGHGGDDEQQVEHGEGHQQPVEGVLPQLESIIESDGRSQTNLLKYLILK